MRTGYRQHAAGLVVLACLLGTADDGQAQATCPNETGYQPTDGTPWCQRSTAYWNKYPDNARATCESRSEGQSPISLRPPADAKAEFGQLVFNYGASQPSNLEMENNGHTVELLLNSQQYEAQDPSAPPERTITVSGTRYVLQNAHFHYPSEHLLDGARFPMELHIVHQAGTQRVVVAVLLKIGVANPALDALFNNMSATNVEGKKARVPYDALNLMQVLPADGTYMRYEGSLTTPDCGTGVTWLVFRTPVEVSQDQINKFTAAITEPLGFPVNARQWRESTAEVSLWAPSNRPSISCVSVQADQFDCFVRGPDQALWHYSSFFRRWDNHGGTLLNAPECVSWGPNRIDCFIRSADQAMWRKTWDGNSCSGQPCPQDWVSHGGTIREQPRCISWGANRIDCFARVGTAMQTIWFDGAWHAWTPIAQGGELLSPPECVSREPFRLDCFARGRLLDGAGKPTTAPRTIHSWFDGAAWRGWEDFGRDMLEQPSCTITWGLIYCYARGSDRSMWRRWRRIDDWNEEWTNFGGVLLNAPSCLYPDCFTRGPDQAMHNHTGWEWQTLGGPIAEQPHCIARDQNTVDHPVDCFARGYTGALWHRRKRNREWSAWENLGGMILE